MLTARLAVVTLVSAASIAEEDLPVDLVIVASVVVATRSGMLHRAEPREAGPAAAALRVKLMNRPTPCGCVGRSAACPCGPCLAPCRCETRWGAWHTWTHPAGCPGVGGCLPINRRRLLIGSLPQQLSRHSTQTSNATRKHHPPNCSIHLCIVINCVMLGAPDVSTRVFQAGHPDLLLPLSREKRAKRQTRQTALRFCLIFPALHKARENRTSGKLGTRLATVRQSGPAILRCCPACFPACCSGGALP